MSVCNELDRVRQIQRDFSVILALLPYRFWGGFGCFLFFFLKISAEKEVAVGDSLE